MATIETAEGDSLVVDRITWSSSLYATGKLDIEGRALSKSFDVRVSDLYRKTALGHDERPGSKGDLSAGVMRTIADLIIGHAVNEDWADRRSGVSIDEFTVESRERSKRADQPIDPSFHEDWPADGSASDKVRFLLDEMPTQTDEEMALMAGCSRSLVSDIKNRGSGD